jgi:ArsR family transcriptional regulator, arsenate/arsenite/antimonite-responsive transcriptional repressor
MVNIIKLSKAMADKNRLKVIQMLSEGQMNVGDVADTLNVEENLASHHLRVLATLGFLTSNKRGREVFYSINKSRFVSLVKQLNKNETFSEILSEALD